VTSDEALMDEIRQGRRAAFETLFDRYREPIWAFFRRRTPDEGRAEELAQDTFVAVLEGAARYERRGTFRSYLFGIAYNVLLADRRKAAHRATDGLDAEPPARDFADPDPGIWVRDALARLRQIGQVIEDTQGSQDVTDQIVDLDARLASARATEQRLTELLRNRTGKLSDVLEVERELARVRLDIERLDAEKTNTARRVTYATIDINIAEERKAGLDAGPLSLATRIRVAAADGLESALESVAWTVLFLLRTGPTLILWSVVVAVVWLVLRRRVRFGIRDSGLGIRDPR
jgi:RNA polymerase sigma factor (sigma-70 family)